MRGGGDAALFFSRRTSPKLVPLECQDRTPTVVHVVCGRFAVSFRVEQPSRGLPVRRDRGLVGQSTCLGALLGEYGQVAGRAERTLATWPAIAHPLRRQPRQRARSIEGKRVRR